jgi:hypothetical protein
MAVTEHAGRNGGSFTGEDLGRFGRERFTGENLERFRERDLSWDKAGAARGAMQDPS